MDGIIWLFLALIVALVALGAVLAGLRRLQPQIKTDHCPSCRTPMSLRRVPLAMSHALLGEWKCPHCGSRISKRGRAGTAT
jgi:ribosomal protein L37AE/L43A